MLFTTAGQLLGDLCALDSDSALRRRLRHYARPQLLVIDEVGYLSYSNRHADLLFELVSRRYQNKSTLITTNRPFAEWREVFPNAACVVSLVDRLVHHAEISPSRANPTASRKPRERAEQRARQRRGSQVMSKPPSHGIGPHICGQSPSAFRFWTPEQALAVFELLDELRDKIWTRYGSQVQPILQQFHGQTACHDDDGSCDDQSF